MQNKRHDVPCLFTVHRLRVTGAGASEVAETEAAKTQYLTGTSLQFLLSPRRETETLAMITDGKRFLLKGVGALRRGACPPFYSLAQFSTLSSVSIYSLSPPPLWLRTA